MDLFHFLPYQAHQRTYKSHFYSFYSLAFFSTHKKTACNNICQFNIIMYKIIHKWHRAVCNLSQDIDKIEAM